MTASTSVVQLLKKIWRTATPHSLRRYFAKNKFKQGLIRQMATNTIYDDWYFDHAVAPSAKSSAPAFVRIINDLWSPRSVIDIGCGTGALLFEFKKYGLITFGLDLSDASIQRCLSQDLAVKKFDAGRWDLKSVSSERFDCAICLELAEHIPESCAEQLLNNLTQASDKILFSAATPDQGGTDHKNEQPHEYWINLFRRRQYIFSEYTFAIRNDLERSHVASFYSSNVMIFEKETP